MTNLPDEKIQHTRLHLKKHIEANKQAITVYKNVPPKKYIETNNQAITVYNLVNSSEKGNTDTYVIVTQESSSL